MLKIPPADAGLIPASGRSPGEGNGNPLQPSSLENPMDRGAWQAAVYGIDSVHNWVCTRTRAHTHTHTPPLNSSSPSPLPIFSSWQPPSSVLSVWFNYSAHLIEIKSCSICLLSHRHCTGFQFFHILINTYFLIFFFIIVILKGVKWLAEFKFL